MNIPKGTKVTYLQDPKNPKRVMTLAYKLGPEDSVSFSYSVNRPTLWKTTQESIWYNYQSIYKDLQEGDQFSKKTGCNIALGRLNSRPTSVALNGDKPKIACLKALETDSNSVVCRIAKYALACDKAVKEWKKEFTNWCEESSEDKTAGTGVISSPIPEYDYHTDWEY